MAGVSAKNESLELEGLTAAVDSMLLQVKFDNTLLSNSLARAFDEVGTHRYRTDSTMTDYYHIRQSDVQPILSVLPGIEPAWSLPAQPVALPDSLSSTLNYYLLANEEEFKRLRKYVEAPAKLIVDYKYEAVKRKVGESGYLRLSGRLSTDRHRRIDRAHQDGQLERAGICLNPTCKKKTGQTFPFRAQQGQVLQGGEKDFPENAPVRGIAKVYLLSGRLSFL